MARAADGGDGEALAFFIIFSVMFAVRDDKKRTAKYVYRAIFCRVLFAVRFRKNARQSLCRAFYRICRAPQTHGNPSDSRSDASRHLSLWKKRRR
jgi:hypothetical protein